jgi:hypothetical protein
VEGHTSVQTASRTCAGTVRGDLGIEWRMGMRF